MSDLASAFRQSAAVWPFSLRDAVEDDEVDSKLPLNWSGNLARPDHPRRHFSRAHARLPLCGKSSYKQAKGTRLPNALGVRHALIDYARWLVMAENPRMRFFIKDMKENAIRAAQTPNPKPQTLNYTRVYAA